MQFRYLAAAAMLCAGSAWANDNDPRAREVGLAPGIYEPGTYNAITDVAGVLVGHVSIIADDAVRTGVTAILPHGGNLYQNKVPAGFSQGNGYGKMMGTTQIIELGEVETPILLTNTLSVPEAAAGVIDWTLAQDGNEAVRSVNAVVGETNDGRINNIRLRAVRPQHAIDAISAARSGTVAEGSIGAGMGTVSFGWKGGIGTSSRVLPAADGGFTVGVLVQTNYGGELMIMGRPVRAQDLLPAADQVASAQMRLCPTATWSDWQRDLFWVLPARARQCRTVQGIMHWLSLPQKVSGVPRCDVSSYIRWRTGPMS